MKILFYLYPVQVRRALLNSGSDSVRRSIQPLAIASPRRRHNPSPLSRTAFAHFLTRSFDFVNLAAIHLEIFTMSKRWDEWASRNAEKKQSPIVHR